MPIDLYVGPRRKRSGRVLLLIGSALLLLAELIVWQQGWRPNQILASLRQEVLPVVPLPVAQLMPQSTSTRADAVLRVNSTVIENPDSEAYTADLYITSTSEAALPPWPNVAGRTKVQTYTVQTGDTLWGIAAQFDLDLDTLRWSNPDLERNPDLLPVGMELVILPVQGVYHRVAEDDTIEAIAARYGVTEADIAHYPPNALYPPYELEPGTGLIVPFGRKD